MKHGERVFVFVANLKCLSWSELISIGSEHNKHISNDSANENDSCLHSVNVCACLDCVWGHWTGSLCCIWDTCEHSATVRTLRGLGSWQRYRSCQMFVIVFPHSVQVVFRKLEDGLCALARLNKLVFVSTGTVQQYHSMSCSSQVSLCRCNPKKARRHSAIS